MATSSERYFVNNVGDNTNNAKLAIGAAIQICKQNGWNLTVITSTAGDFPHTIYGQIFTPQRSGQTCSHEGMTISIDIPRNLRMTQYDMIFGAHLSLHDMEKVDAANAKAIFYIPWLESDGQAWIDRWNPQIIGNSPIQHTPTPINQFVEKELARITRVINLSTGLTHPSDKQLAESAFKDLARNGHTDTLAAIKNWALQNSWNPRHVEQLIKVASKYFK